MDATIMLSTTQLISLLQSKYPELYFKQGSMFYWSSDDKTIYYNDSEKTNFNTLLIHELAHATLEHSNYDRDIELLTMERQAWDKAIEISNKHKIDINKSLVQPALDSYRGWLHSRSKCPKCQSNGMQTSKHIYKCLICSCKWKANEAKICSLRRYIEK